MRYLPVFFDVRERSCLVIGAGETARRKAELLLRAGARVRVSAARLDERLAAMAAEGLVEHDAAPLAPERFAGCALAVVALDDPAEAERAAQLASAAGVPVNVVDRPALCSFIVPAIVDRSPVVIAVSTAGAAPVLGRLLRARLEALVPPATGRLAALAGELRDEVRAALPARLRRRFWEEVLDGPIGERVASGALEEARALIRERLRAPRSSAAGEVVLVAVPPERDADALTLRGLRLLQRSDDVVHDPDLPQALLDLIRRDAGRSAGDARAPGPIVARLVELARGGQRVAWLTGAAGAGSAARRQLERAVAEAGLTLREAR